VLAYTAAALAVMLFTGTGPRGVMYITILCAICIRVRPPPSLQQLLFCLPLLCLCCYCLLP
jgi:hypothetical protein